MKFIGKLKTNLESCRMTLLLRVIY